MYSTWVRDTPWQRASVHLLSLPIPRQEDEKSLRKHKHKKQKDKSKDPGRHSDKHSDKGDGEEKKRKKKKSRGNDGEVSTVGEVKPDFDELEAFLEGPSLGSPSSSGPSYEALWDGSSQTSKLFNTLIKK